MTQTVLLVEDDPDDAMLFHYAVRTARLDVNLRVVEDGREALRYLNGDGDYGDREKHPFPCIILLDLKLPFVPGLEVLKKVRSSPATRRMVVIILTSSQADSDIASAYELGANSYLVKPSSVDERQELVKRIHDYWLLSNRLESELTVHCARAGI